MAAIFSLADLEVMRKGIFADFDFDQFWDNSEYAAAEYVGRRATSEMIRTAEAELGCALPRSYVELVTRQNGGMPRCQAFRTTARTSWAPDHIAIHGLFGVDPLVENSLLGALGNRHWIGEWGYPDIGVYIADCPSAGHDMVCLDYRECGPEGEPTVVHVDQEFDYKVTLLAESFEAFIRGLISNEAIDRED